MIARQFKENEVDILDLSKVSLLKLEEYDRYIFGISTVGADSWNDSNTKNVWDNFYMIIQKIEIKGKKAAIFGLGDQLLYPDHFCDDMSLLKTKLEAQGATIIGHFPADNYTFTGSKSFEKGKFTGLPIDNESQGELTEERIIAWTEQLKKEFE
jgi:flavodoxin I